MSGHEELLERIAPFVWDYSHGHARALLAEVRRTLEAVTPEMSEAGDCAFENGYVHEVYSAMLRASPLTPPKEKSP